MYTVLYGPGTQLLTLIILCTLSDIMFLFNTLWLWLLLIKNSLNFLFNDNYLVKFI